MASNISQEDLDFFKGIIKEAEPYSEEEFEQICCFDGKSHLGDQRYTSTSALRALLHLGFSEDEVNPWKNRKTEDAG